MNITLTLDQAIAKASPRLQSLMRHSVEVLQKGEKLAKMYDPEMGYWLGFSGGKDSQTLLHMAQLANVSYHAFFSPTSVDPPELIRFIRREYPEIAFLKLTRSIYTEFVRKKILPSMRIRWCCAEFKEKGGEGKVVLVGVRHAESARRATRGTISVLGHKFNGEFDDFDKWSTEKRAKREKALANKREKMRRAYEKGKITEEEYKQFDQFTQRGEKIVTCVGGKDKIVISPILEWEERDVWEFLNKVVEVPHCELYDQGFHRIGCICCPMANIKSTLRDIDRWPHVKEKWIKAIMQVRREGKSAYGKNDNFLYRIGIENGKILNATAKGTTANTYTEEEEHLIAEGIFDWWISKKSFAQWYADKYAPTLGGVDFDTIGAEIPTNDLPQ